MVVRSRRVFEGLPSRWHTATAAMSRAQQSALFYSGHSAQEQVASSRCRGLFLERLCVAFSWRYVRYLTRTNKRGVGGGSEDRPEKPVLSNRDYFRRTKRLLATDADASPVVRLVLNCASDFRLLRRGGRKSAKNEGIPGSAHATNRPQRSQSIAHQYRLSASAAVAYIRQLPGRDLCFGRGTGSCRGSACARRELRS